MRINKVKVAARPSLAVPDRYNYIACFLTLDCNLNCSYCLNYFGGIKKLSRKNLTGKEWVEGLNRIKASADLPVTLQGGEPSLHPDFLWIIKNIKKSLRIDILTNLGFDVAAFISNIDPQRLTRDAPYPSIRVSYHPEYTDLHTLLRKVKRLHEAGFSIGVFTINDPRSKQHIVEARKRCLALGIDFRTKEFLGIFRGKLYGTYRYRGAVGTTMLKQCRCRNSELIIGPEGSIYRCHRELYHGTAPLGSLMDGDFKINDTFRACNYFGQCNPCDIKIKTNRFQVYGHTSVEIKNIRKRKPVR